MKFSMGGSRLYYYRLMDMNFAVDYKSMLGSDFRDAIELISLSNISNV